MLLFAIIRALVLLFLLEPAAAFGPLALVEIVEASILLYNSIQKAVERVAKEKAKRMEVFIHNECTIFSRRFPYQNYVVWHRQKHDPTTLFVNKVENSTDLHFWGYTVETMMTTAFDYGAFEIHDDMGYRNWGFGGNFLRDPPDGPVVTWLTWELPTAYIRGPAVLEPRLGRKQVPAWNSSLFMSSEIFVPAEPPSTLTSTPFPWDIPVHKHRPVAAAAAGLQDYNVIPHDGTHFVFCNSTLSNSSNSGIAYYREMKAGTKTGRMPDDFVWVELNHNPFFRRSTGVAEFLDGAVSVQWSIFGNAMESTTKPNTLAGVANDGKDHFHMYKDDGRELFSTEEYTCFTQYYAF